jgi:hypothetical protein
MLKSSEKESRSPSMVCDAFDDGGDDITEAKKWRQISVAATEPV